MNDSEILTLIRTGSSAKALDALYKSYPAVRKMIRNTGGNNQDAEDIFQEALIILCRKIRQTDFTLTARLGTYLYSVCRYLWKDQLKMQNRQVPGDPESLPVSALPSEETAINDILEKEQAFRMAEKVIGELGDRCRELLLLFYNARLSLKDIAGKMAYGSEQSAKNQKYKCLENARNTLKEWKTKTPTF